MVIYICPHIKVIEAEMGTVEGGRVKQEKRADWEGMEIQVQ